MKNLLLAALATAATALTLLAPGVAEAGNYVVYVHGRSECGNPDASSGACTSGSGWSGGTRTISGYSSVNLTYNATTATLATANDRVTSQLRTYCSGGNNCIVVSYSNGDLNLQRTMANAPDALSGLIYAESASSAAGGADYAGACSFVQWFGGVFGWDVCYPSGVDGTLSTSAARNAYNHNNSKTTYRISGNTNAYNWMFYLTSWTVLPGDDDGVVSYHSTFGCNSTGSQNADCGKYQGQYRDSWANSASCSKGECGGGWFSGGTDHFGMPSKGTANF
jgi:hypothetical protein